MKANNESLIKHNITGTISKMGLFGEYTQLHSSNLTVGNYTNLDKEIQESLNLVNQQYLYYYSLPNLISAREWQFSMENLSKLLQERVEALEVKNRHDSWDYVTLKKNLGLVDEKIKAVSDFINKRREYKFNQIIDTSYENRRKFLVEALKLASNSSLIAQKDFDLVLEYQKLKVKMVSPGTIQQKYKKDAIYIHDTRPDTESTIHVEGNQPLLKVVSLLRHEIGVHAANYLRHKIVSNLINAAPYHPDTMKNQKKYREMIEKGLQEVKRYKSILKKTQSELKNNEPDLLSRYNPIVERFNSVEDMAIDEKNAAMLKKAGAKVGGLLDFSTKQLPLGKVEILRFEKLKESAPCSNENLYMMNVRVLDPKKFFLLTIERIENLLNGYNDPEEYVREAEALLLQTFDGKSNNKDDTNEILRTFWPGILDIREKFCELAEQKIRLVQEEAMLNDKGIEAPDYMEDIEPSNYQARP